MRFFVTLQLTISGEDSVSEALASAMMTALYLARETSTHKDLEWDYSEIDGDGDSIVCAVKPLPPKGGVSLE